LEDIKEEHEEHEASPVKLIRDEPLVFEAYSSSETVGLARTTSSRNVNPGTTTMNDRSPMTNRSLRSNQSWKKSFGEVIK
jgi:WD40 repeat protein